MNGISQAPLERFSAADRKLIESKLSALPVRDVELVGFHGTRRRDQTLLDPHLTHEGGGIWCCVDMADALAHSKVRGGSAGNTPTAYEINVRGKAIIFPSEDIWRNAAMGFSLEELRCRPNLPEIRSILLDWFSVEIIVLEQQNTFACLQPVRPTGQYPP